LARGPRSVADACSPCPYERAHVHQPRKRRAPHRGGARRRSRGRSETEDRGGGSRRA
jgi:hypothetical protein